MTKPLKIALLGFADSKDEAPFDDPSWEIWGVNDVYAHVKRVTKSFELHETSELIDQGRRNPTYFNWLKEGKLPVYTWQRVIDLHPEFVSAIPFPESAVRAAFGDYFTNSIAWMTAFALLELCEVDEKGVMHAREGAELGLWGIDMAHETEYGAQRPSCEFYIGIAKALGVNVYIPATSDLLKTGSLYGIETTAPMRIKMEKRIAKLSEQLNGLNAQRQQFQMQIAHVEASMNQIKGAIGMAKYVRGVWTNGTEIAPSIAGDHQRTLGVPKSDGQIVMEVDQNGSLDLDGLMKQIDAQDNSLGRKETV